MLGFIQSWFAPGANPIGVDFGSDSLRLAQVECIAGAVPGAGDEVKLIAAARADVPPYLRDDPSSRADFFVQTVRELTAQGNFRGRRAVLALPASLMSVRHLRLPRMDEKDLRQALAWEARGKLPYDPSRALLRHLVAGEIYQDGEQKSEIILMAALRESVDGLLAAARKARLDVVAMTVEPKALIDCFSYVYRRKADVEATSCYVDIGLTATRAIIARGGQILFARVIPVGGEHFNRAVGAGLGVGPDEARAARARTAPEALLSQENASPDEPAPASPAAPPDTARIDEALREPVKKLVDELALCRHYHETTFPNLPVTRLIFVGGESRHRGLCQQIARGLDLSAQLGDPLARLGRHCEVGPESGIDRRLPQPDWAVAIGLSMGAVPAPAPAPVRPESAAAQAPSERRVAT